MLRTIAVFFFLHLFCNPSRQNLHSSINATHNRRKYLSWRNCALNSRLLKTIMTMVKHKPEQQTSHLTEPQAPGPLTLERVLEEFNGCSDLSHRSYPSIQADIIYFDHLVDNHKFINNVIIPLENIQREELGALLQQSQFVREEETKNVIQGILEGEAALFVPQGVYLISAYGPDVRSIEQSETESVIVGPHDAFNESLDTNLSIIRRRLKSNRLKVVQFEVGEVFKTKVCMLYIDGFANMDFVNRMSERIQGIESSGMMSSC